MSEDAPRLYLITPPLTDAAFAAALEAALQGGDIACVYLRTASAAPVRAVAKSLAPIAQRRGAACLVGDPQAAADVGADGVHIETPGPGLESALRTMKPGHIVGIGGLATRDDAMRAGESGADYVMFGAPGEAMTSAQVHERVVWWADIFNLPCVAYARTLAEAGELADAGADFIALEGAVWDDPRGPAAAVAAAEALIAARRIGP